MFDVISLERLFDVMQGKGLEVSIGFIEKIMYILWFYLKWISDLTWVQQFSFIACVKSVFLKIIGSKPEG